MMREKHLFNYCVIRYVHDTVADESLNIGVALFSREGRFAHARMEHRYRRLGQTFLDFDGQQFYQAILRFQTAMARVQEDLFTNISLFGDDVSDVHSVISKIWHDLGLNFRLGPVMLGHASNLEDELDDLFERYVGSQYRQEKQVKRNDEDVYSVYNRFIRNQKIAISHRIESHTFRVGKMQLPFAHAVKNDRWHPLQPVSFDFSSRDAIRDKTSRILGKAALLEDNKDLGSVYVLFGRPTQGQQLLDDYEEAKSVIKERFRIPAQFYEEDDGQKFAQDLTSFMIQHKLVKPAEQQTDSSNKGLLHVKPEGK